MIDLALYFMEFPEPEWILAQTFNDFSGNPDFKGPWGIPETGGAKMDVETAAHAFIRFKTGQVLFSRMSWAENIKWEEVSVVCQGKKSGLMVRSIFDKEGADSTATDEFEIFAMKNHLPVNHKLIVEPDETMGRERSVANFVNTVRGKEKPFSTPAEAVILMKIIDALYRSAESGKPIKLSA
jgi:predicted dehydrogenase